MKKWIVLNIIILMFAACNNSSEEKKEAESDADKKEEVANGNPSYDPKRGEGKFSKVDIPANLDVAKAEAGDKVFTGKCSACHKLSDEKLVGPGWKGVTSRHSAEWIMNLSTNPDEMLNKDPKAQAMLEICLVRMPNQNLSDAEARNILEFMRKNDGVK